MTRANPDVDLDALARKPAAASTRIVRPRRRWLRVAVPLALLGGFAAILAASLGDFLRGGVEVQIVRPTPAAGGVAATAGEVVAQASGYVEPDPFPIRAIALSGGVVRELLVQEADAVKAGDPLARLVDEDARIARDRAAAALVAAEAECQRAESMRAAAQASFEAALAPKEALATARAELEGKRAERAHREQAAEEARAQLGLAEDELEVQRFLATEGAAGPRAVELAEGRVAEARAALERMRAEAALAGAEESAAAARAERAERDFELRIEDKLRLAEAQAMCAAARSRADGARADLAEADLRLERTVVRAPAAGVVLQRLAAPGADLSAPESGGAVAALYDPASIRVRVDVPNEDVSKLFPEQEARIEARSREGRPYAGRVIRLVRLGDIQKQTLAVHVRVLDADEWLRPDMVCQVKFLAAGTAPETGAAAATAGRVRIPAALLVDSPEGPRVWVLDALGRTAELRAVETGARAGGEVEILSGLNLSDKLIASPRDRLRPGREVRVAAKAGGD